MLTLRTRTRSLLIAVALLLPIIGAAVGALWSPPAANPYRATALVIPATESNGAEAGPQMAARLVEVGRTSGIGALAGNAISPLGGVPVHPRFEISATATGAVRITSMAPTANEATNGATAFATELALLAKSVSSQLTGSGVMPLTDFGRGVGGWGAASTFSRPPVSIRVVRHDPRFGPGLVAACSAQADCGVASDFDYPLIRGTVYQLVAWVRSTGRSRAVVLVLGRNSSDYGASRPIVVGTHSKRVSIQWIPKSFGETAEADVQQVRGPTGGFAVAAVALIDPTAVARVSIGRLTLGAYRRLAATALPVAVVPPEAADQAAGATVASAGIGAAVALVLLAAAYLSFYAAGRRRRDTTDPDPRPETVSA